MTGDMLIDDVCEYVPEAAEFDFQSPFATVLAQVPEAPLEAILDKALTQSVIAPAQQADLRAWYGEFERIRAAFLVRTGKWLHYTSTDGRTILSEARLPLHATGRESD